MTDDRWRHDPFAPPPNALTGAVAPPEPVEAGDEQGGDTAPEEALEDMTKPELQAELERRGMPTSGNKPDLIARLRGED